MLFIVTEHGRGDFPWNSAPILYSILLISDKISYALIWKCILFSLLAAYHCQNNGREK